MYATAPGSVASDGTGNNGLFTSKLIKYIDQPNINIEQVFKYVAREVQQDSEGAQVPWINYSYFGDFYFSPREEINQPSNIKENTASIVTPIVQNKIPEATSTTSSNYFLEALNKETIPRLEIPGPSPRSVIYSDLGFTEVSVDCSRPLRRDRKIFGEGSEYVVPYGKIWRTGANMGFRVYFSSDVIISEKLISKGAYAVYTWPNAKSWYVSLYKDLNLGGNTSGYDINNEVIKFEAPTLKTNEIINTFTARINRISNNSGAIQIAYENQTIRNPFVSATNQSHSNQLKSSVYQKIGITDVVINHYNSLEIVPKPNGLITLGSVSIEDKTIIADKIFEPGNYDLHLKDDKLFISTQELSAKPIENSQHAEGHISIEITELLIDKKSATLQITIGKKQFTMPLIVDYDSRIDRMISSVTNSSPKSGEYISAATYYFENNLDLRKALEWVDLGIQSGSQDAFWNVHLKAKIQKAIGDRKGALVTAQLSLDMAKRSTSGDFGYIKINEDLIRTLN